MSIEDRHLQACARGEPTYVDPQTGYRVFTAVGLERRGDCCGCGCRHCPYGHIEVDEARRRSLTREPWLEGSVEDGAFDVLFWSGGKDSYLALRALQREAEREVVLLTTFDGRTEKVAHQEVTLEQIRRQREALKLAQVFVPLYPSEPYEDRVAGGLRTFERRARVERLVFGDLHLEHVRQWRLKAFGAHPVLAGYSSHFPLWGVRYDELLADLEASPGRATVSAVTHEGCRDLMGVGDTFSSALVARLPEDVDAFGENGEFHSYVEL